MPARTPMRRGAAGSGSRERPTSSATAMCSTSASTCSGVPARAAEAEEGDLGRPDREAGTALDPPAQVTELLVVQVLHRATALADEVMVGVLARRLEVGTVAAEVGAEEQALLDEQLERAVDRGGVHVRKLRPDQLDDVLRAEVPVRLVRECLPDQLSLPGHAPALGAQLARTGAQLVDVSVRPGLRRGHGFHDDSTRDRTGAAAAANHSRHSEARLTASDLR